MRNESTMIFFHCWWRRIFCRLPLAPSVASLVAPSLPSHTWCQGLWAHPSCQNILRANICMPLHTVSWPRECRHVHGSPHTLEPSNKSTQSDVNSTNPPQYLQSFNSSRQQRQHECKWGQETGDRVKFSGKKKWTFRRSQKAHGGITAYTASLYLGLERRLYE